MTKLIKEVLSNEELELLKEIAQQGFDPWVAKRNAALLEVNYRCTLRISESLDLRPGDYSSHDKVLLIRNGKGGKVRRVAIGEKARVALVEWLTIRDQKRFGRDKPIFCSRRGTRLDRNELGKNMKRWAEEAGIEKRVHSHQLRYSGASGMLRKGASLSHIQGQLGHSNPQTTLVYLLQVDPFQRVQDQEKWEP